MNNINIIVKFEIYLTLPFVIENYVFFYSIIRLSHASVDNNFNKILQKIDKNVHEKHIKIVLLNWPIGAVTFMVPCAYNYQKTTAYQKCNEIKYQNCNLTKIHDQIL